MRHFILSFIILTSPYSFSQEEWTLDQVISEVLKNDFGIQISKIDTAIAANNNNPGAAGYLPTINATADQNFTISSARQEFLSGVNI